MSNVYTVPCHDGEVAYVGDIVKVGIIDSKKRCCIITGRITAINYSGFNIYENDASKDYFVDYGVVSDVWLVSRGDNAEPEHVDHPSHYQSETGIECIDAIESATFNLTGVEAFDIGNTIKYLWRWKDKNGLEDLKKAQWYLTHLVNHVEKLEKENI